MEDPELIRFESLEAFLAALEQRGIRHAVVRAVREIRPRSLADHQVEVGPQAWVELAAYRGGTLLTATLQGATAPEIQEVLLAHGFAVRTASGNLT